LGRGIVVPVTLVTAAVLATEAVPVVEALPGAEAVPGTVEAVLGLVSAARRVSSRP
jgi:hypothetical protein